jgi:tetratricopeptide (TPR) repeat protein
VGIGENEMSSHVFVCYVREDGEFALHMGQKLKERGIPVWIDQWNIPAGADWDQTIDAAIRDCSHFLIVLSPLAVASHEVRSEYHAALEEKKPIVPVIYQSCQVPTRLRVFQAVDFTDSGPGAELSLELLARVLVPEEPLPVELISPEPIPSPPKKPEDKLVSVEEPTKTVRPSISPWVKRVLYMFVGVIGLILLYKLILPRFLIPSFEKSPAYKRWGITKPSTDETIEKLLADAYILLYNREFEKAKTFYLRVLDKDSNCVEGHVGLSFVYRYTQDDTRSFKECKKALELDSLALAAQWNYGELLWPWRGTTLDVSIPDSERIKMSLYHLKKAAGMNHPASTHAHISLWTAYMALQEVKEARFELREMKRKNYFPKVVLDFAHNLLISAEHNGIIFTNGDMDTYAPFCLQEATKLRQDVSIVNLSLLNTPRFVKCLRDSFGVPISYTDFGLELIEPKMDWEKNKVVSVQDILVKNIIENAHYKNRPVYFAITVSEENRAEHENNLSLEGVVYRVDRGTTKTPVNIEKLIQNMTQNYTIEEIPKTVEWSSNLSPATKDVSGFLNNYAYLYVIIANHYSEQGEVTKASVCYEKAFSIYNYFKDKSRMKALLELWLREIPDDVKAKKLMDKYFGE